MAWAGHDRLGPEILRQWLAVTTTSVSNQFVAIEWDEVLIQGNDAMLIRNQNRPSLDPSHELIIAFTQENFGSVAQRRGRETNVGKTNSAQLYLMYR